MANTVEITPHLTDNPRAQLESWLESVASAARTFCADHSQWGALSLACTEVHWQALHGNPAIAAPRQVFADPGPLDPLANPAVRQQHKDNKQAYADFSSASALLRDGILKSISETDRNNLRDPVTGLDLVTANAVIIHVLAAHGVYTESDIDSFLTKLDTKLEKLTDFDSHAANFRSNLAHLDTAGVPMTQFTAYRAYLLSLSNFPAFKHHVVNYVAATPVVAHRTPAGLANHLRPHIASVSSETHQQSFAGAAAHHAGASPYALAVPPAPTATPVTTRLQNVSSKDMRAVLAARDNRRQPNNGNSGNPGQRTPVTSAVTPPGYRYCYHHGHTRRHGWENGVLTAPCQYMAARPQEFGAAKLNAKTCTDCAGGSRNVQQVYSPPSSPPSNNTHIHKTSSDKTPMSKRSKRIINKSCKKPPILQPNTLPSSLPHTHSKPEYHNPFVLLDVPSPLPPPSFPRDKEGQPITTPQSFIPPPSSHAYSKPPLTTTAKTGYIIYDVEGRETTWKKGSAHSIHDDSTPQPPSNDGMPLDDAMHVQSDIPIPTHPIRSSDVMAHQTLSPDIPHPAASVPQMTTLPLPSSLFFSSPNGFDVLDEIDDRPTTFEDFPSFPPSRPLPQSLPPAGDSAEEGGFFAFSTHHPTRPLSPLSSLRCDDTEKGGNFALDSFSPSIRTLDVYPPSLLSSIRNIKDATFVTYHHRSFGSPSSTTFLHAIRAGWINIRGLDGKKVSRNPPVAIATACGHMDLIRKGLRSSSTKPPVPHTTSTLPDGAVFGPVTRSQSTATHPTNHPSIPDDDIYGMLPSDAVSYTVPRSDWAASDLTGRFPVKSRSGNEYLLVTVYKGYTHLHPQPSRSADSYVSSFKAVFLFFKNLGHVISHIISDNESSSTLRSYFADPTTNVTVQFVPPNNHRANFAERYIRTSKNHIISSLASVHITFPLDLWDRLLPHIQLTLNHLQPWHPDPSISAHHGLYGLPFDFDAHPIHPVGQLCYTLDPASVRPSWSSHSSRSFYIGPAVTHYRCYHMYICTTSSMRVSDSISVFPSPLFHFEDPSTPPEPLPPSPSRPHPTADGSDLIGRWFVDPEEGLCHIISTASPFLKLPSVGNRNPSSPILADGYHYMLRYTTPSGATHSSSLTEVADWVHRFPAVNPSSSSSPPASPPPTQPTPRRTSPRLHPSLNSAGDPLVSAGDPANSAGGCMSFPLSPSCITHLQYSWASDGTLLASASGMPPRPVSHFTSPPPSSHFISSLSSLPDICGIHEPPPAVHPLLAYATALSTLNLDPSGRPLRFSSALSGPNRADWITADIVELVKLVMDTGTLVPVHSPSQPPTYYNRVVKEKLKAGKVERRVRGTIGGDRLSFPYSVSSTTASMTCFKLLLNSVVSSDSNLASADISDFYLGADLPEPESVKIYLSTFPPDVLDKLGFTPFIKTDSSGKTYIYCDVVKSCYGIGSSGLLSQIRLIAQLHSHDYIQTATPCLFRHKTRDITFCLVVDDFAIQYRELSDLQHFTDCLSELFHLKVYPTCTSFLGFTVDYDRSRRTISLSYPSYIPDLLVRLGMEDIPTAKSPCIYVPPIYGSSAPQTTFVDDSPPLSSADTATIQIIVGSLLYYARAVDASMLTAVCLLASHQSAPTQATLRSAMRLLGYAKANPANSLVFKPSDMILRIYSDASYLNRPRSGSTAGGFHFLGTTDLTFINGPVFCHSTRIPVVCAAVSEAEYAALFSNAQVGCDERSILSSLGHPQPPTVIWCDNECAVGLAEETIRPQKSKSIDMRFDWLRCRVRQHQFSITWCSGTDQYADIFTKALPVHVHQQLAPLYATPPPLPTVPLAASAASLSSFVSDTGATHILLRRSCFSSFRHLFTPKSLPALSFSLPDGGILSVRSSDGGSIRFPSKPDPVDCYLCDDDVLAHNLVGVSPLLRPTGLAVYTPTSVRFYSDAAASTPFLTGSKLASENLWHVRFPPPL